MSKLLTREAFRQQVFQRSLRRCVVPGCGKPADDPHHLIERRLWTYPAEKEGYFLENGASLCEPHHQYGAETCVLQPLVLRAWAGIKDTRLPAGWDAGKVYDKWGTVLKQPTRERIKYPSSPYLHLSPGYDPNDINLQDVKPFLNQPLVFTVKMDGSNTCLSRDLVAARNGSHADHASFDLLKAQHARIRERIPGGVQVFGEWLYAKHSIHYAGDLAVKSYFQPFGVYHQATQLFGGWSDVEAMAAKIGAVTVPVLEKGEVYAEEWRLEARISELAEQVIEEGHEGIVVRTMYPFPYANFEGYDASNGKTSWRVGAIAKFVRANHVQTSEHWSQQAIVRNEVA